MIAYEEEPNYRSDAQQIVWDRPSRKAILLGSRARGTEHEGSAWDILVLLDKPKVTLLDYDKYSYPLRELGWDIDETINPVLFSQKEWEENRHTLFNHNVTREGIVIWQGDNYLMRTERRLYSTDLKKPFEPIKKLSVL